MDAEMLRRYKTNKRELHSVGERIRALEDGIDLLPVVKDKVSRSSDDYPYILEHLTVSAPDPHRAHRIHARLLALQKRAAELEAEIQEVEKFIDDLPEGVEKRVFEMVYLDGMSQNQAAQCVGYTQARVSQLIREGIKASEKSEDL